MSRSQALMLVCCMLGSGCRGCHGAVPPAEEPAASPAPVSAEAEPDEDLDEWECPTGNGRFAGREETVRLLQRSVEGPWDEQERALARVERTLASCLTRWHAEEERSGCAVPGSVSMDELEYAAIEDEITGDLPGFARARASGDLFEVEVSTSDGQGTESGSHASVTRVRLSTCEGIGLSWNRMFTELTGSLHLDAGGHAALEATLLAQEGLERADPSRPEHDLAALLVQGPHAVKRDWRELEWVEDAPRRCTYGGDGPCIGGPYALPPWRPGPPRSAPAVVGDRILPAMPPARAARYGRWTLWVAVASRWGHLRAYAIHDEVDDRSRWVGIDEGYPVHRDEEEAVERLSAVPGFLGVGRRLVDLGGGRVFPTWPAVSQENVGAFAEAARAGRCDVDCRSPAELDALLEENGGS